MNTAFLPASRPVRGLIVFGFWTVIGLFFALQSIVTYLAGDGEVHVAATLVFRMSHWYAWGLLAPLIFRFARRFPLDRRRWPVHLGAALVMAPLQVVLSSALRIAGFLVLGTLTVEQVPDFLARIPAFVLTGSFDGLVTYAAILGIFYIFDFYRKYRERELRTTQLEGQLAQAQLTALKMQLHPHFLFNTLNSISALVRKDPDQADRMIARLSDLLRITLESAGTQEVSLREEQAFLEHYLEIEQIRFADRLTVSFRMDPETLDARVPNLILQPLVEIAIRHGIAPRPTPGRIEIRSERVGEHLRLTVSDDGPGLPTGDGLPREGVGLRTTRERLEKRFGPDHRFALHSPPDGGLTVSLLLPFAAPIPA